MLYEFLKAEFTRNPLTKVAALVAYPVLKAFKRRVDPRRYNGATLIGLKGVVVKSHGGADVLAFQQRADARPTPKSPTACSTRSPSGWRRCPSRPPRRPPSAPVAPTANA